MGGSGNKQENGKDNSDDAKPMTQDEEAANDLFVQDSVDAAGEKDKDNDKDNDKDDGKDDDVDDSVESDGRTRRLEQMANMMMDRLDKDDSGDLSKDEFLNGPRKFGKHWKHHGKKKKHKKDDDEADDVGADDADDEKEDQGDAGGDAGGVIKDLLLPDFENKVKNRFSEAFTKFAGDDDKLSVEELIELLKDQLPNVGKFREKHHKGKHKDRVKASWDEILAEYDDDGDKLLNQQEFEAIEKDRQERGRKWRKRDKHFGKRD